ncbi:MAG: hypothetical protein ABMA15_04170 [Vicinamibacterales bacterium]
MMRLTLIHGNAGPRALHAVQIYISSLWLAKALTDPLSRLAVLPRSYYEPVGVLQLVPTSIESWLLSAGGLTSLRCALIMTSALCLWPRAFRWISPVCFALVLVYQSLIRGFGHANHAEILLILALGLLATFAWTPLRRHNEGYSPYGIPVLAVALTITVCYSLIGLLRLYDGVAQFTGDSIVNYVVSRSLRTSYYDFNVGMIAVTSPVFVWLLRLGFPLVSIVEALSPLVLVSRPFRVVFFTVMIPFHLMTLTLMEVSFLENLLLYVVLVDFSRWLPVFALGGLDSHQASSLGAVGRRRLAASETA